MDIALKTFIESLCQEGAYADVTVKLGLVKLLHKQFDICEEAYGFCGSTTVCMLIYLSSSDAMPTQRFNALSKPGPTRLHRPSLFPEKSREVCHSLNLYSLVLIFFQPNLPFTCKDILLTTMICYVLT